MTKMTKLILPLLVLLGFGCGQKTAPPAPQAICFWFYCHKDNPCDRFKNVGTIEDYLKAKAWTKTTGQAIVGGCVKDGIIIDP